VNAARRERPDFGGNARGALHQRQVARRATREHALRLRRRAAVQALEQAAEHGPLAG
jgi:hypothetical protein